MSPTELRERSRLYREAATGEPTPALKLYLARHAHALEQLAERIERARGTSPLQSDPADP